MPKFKIVWNDKKGRQHHTTVSAINKYKAQDYIMDNKKSFKTLVGSLDMKFKLKTPWKTSA